MSFRAWIVAEAQMFEALTADGSAIKTQMEWLHKLTGRFQKSREWKYGTQIPAWAGSIFLEAMLTEGGGSAFTSSDYMVAGPLVDEGQIPLSKLNALFNYVNSATVIGSFPALNTMHFDLVNYRSVIRIPIAAKATAVPAYLPDRLDADNNPLTWETYKRANYSLKEDGTYLYVPSNSRTRFALAGSIQKRLVDDGASIISLAAYRALEL